MFHVVEVLRGTYLVITVSVQHNMLNSNINYQFARFCSTKVRPNSVYINNTHNIPLLIEHVTETYSILKPQKRHADMAEDTNKKLVNPYLRHCINISTRRRNGWEKKLR